MRGSYCGRPSLRGDDPGTWDVARNLLKGGARAGGPAAARQFGWRFSVRTREQSWWRISSSRAAHYASTRRSRSAVRPTGAGSPRRPSGLAAFKPTHVLVAPTTADLDLPQLAEHPAAVLDAEEARWRRLWDGIGTTIGARVIQHAFVVPDETPLGHLALRLPGSKLSLVRELNARLGAAAESSVLLVDCERLASRIGKQSWLDPRLWQATRQPVSHAALPLLARETAAVLAGDLGLAARCLVVDLDNTLWGGLVGEEGPPGRHATAWSPRYPSEI